MDASTVSAGIAALSATISAVSAWNARRSALASESALRETAVSEKSIVLVKCLEIWGESTTMRWP